MTDLVSNHLPSGLKDDQIRRRVRAAKTYSVRVAEVTPVPETMDDPLVLASV